jgi:hypothetical protein
MPRDASLLFFPQLSTFCCEADRGVNFLLADQNKYGNK